MFNHFPCSLIVNTGFASQTQPFTGLAFVHVAMIHLLTHVTAKEASMFVLFRAYSTFNSGSEKFPDIGGINCFSFFGNLRLATQAYM